MHMKQKMGNMWEIFAVVRGMDGIHAAHHSKNFPAALDIRGTYCYHDGATICPHGLEEPVWSTPYALRRSQTLVPHAQFRFGDTSRLRMKSRLKEI